MEYTKLSEELMNTVPRIGCAAGFRALNKCNEGEIKLMYYLCEVHPEGAYAGELSAVSHLTTGRVAIVLNGLEKKGYISRKKDFFDKRKVFVSATEYGKNETLKMYIDTVKVLSGLLEQLGEQDAKELVRIIKKFSDLSVATENS